jgi:hypothetical protein
VKLLPLGVLAFALGWWSAQPPETEVYSATFLIRAEDGYGNGKKDGIQYFALQRMDSNEIDSATLAIDADLPLAKHMSALSGNRVRLTLADAGLRTLQR